jgi:hypothetical protein
MPQLQNNKARMCVSDSLLINVCKIIINAAGVSKIECYEFVAHSAVL